MVNSIKWLVGAMVLYNVIHLSKFKSDSRQTISESDLTICDSR